MWKKLSVLAALLLLSAVVWWVASAPRGSSPLGETSDAAPALVAERGPEPPPPTAATARQPVPATTTTDESYGAARVRVLWADDQSPAVGIHAQVFVWSRPNHRTHVIRDVTDDDGRFACAGLEPGRVGVYLDRADGKTFDVHAGQTAEETILLPRGIEVTGKVVDDSDRAVPGAELWLAHMGNNTGEVVALADAEGAFSIPGATRGMVVAARATGHAPTRPVPIEAGEGNRFEVTLVLPGEGAAVRGVVRGPTAGPRLTPACS